MAFLTFLEGLRQPVLTAFFSVITYLGDETCFMALAMLLFWCVNKRQGYYLFAVGFAGIAASQMMKLYFRVPRPWVLDPDFTIVESARAGAGGYSFPSGHTQSIVGTLGVIAVSNRQKWVRWLCLAGVILVPFSRMYLGVHTPLDVGVGFALSAVLVAALWFVFRDDAHFARGATWVLLGLLALAVVYLLFVLRYPFPADIDPENYAEGVKNAWVMLGVVVGLLVSRFVDEKKLHFDVAAPLLGQVCKLVLGMALLVAIRVVLKAPLLALFHGSVAADAVRYCCMVLFAGCVWPLTFPLWQKVGAKK